MPRRTFGARRRVLLAHRRLAGQQLLEQPAAAARPRRPARRRSSFSSHRRHARGRRGRAPSPAPRASPGTRSAPARARGRSPSRRSRCRRARAAHGAENVPPPLTVAVCPSTRTAAPAGVTVPRTSTVAARTVAMSSGAVTSSSTGRGGACARGSSPPPQPGGSGSETGEDEEREQAHEGTLRLASSEIRAQPPPARATAGRVRRDDAFVAHPRESLAQIAVARAGHGLAEVLDRELVGDARPYELLDRRHLRAAAAGEYADAALELARRRRARMPRK